MQVVVVEAGGRPVVVGGDVAVWFGQLDEPHTEGQLRVRALDPEAAAMGDRVLQPPLALVDEVRSRAAGSRPTARRRRQCPPV
jgi:hypothetical protein